MTTFDDTGYLDAFDKGRRMDKPTTESSCIIVSMLGGEVVLHRDQVEHIIKISGQIEVERNTLRSDRDGLKARVEEFGAAFDAWWGHYSTQSSDKKQNGWGWIDEAWANLKQSVQRPTTSGGDE